MRQRAAWLEDVARRFDRSPTPISPGAGYTRRWRQRERSGKCLLRVEVDEAALTVALIDRGLLNPLEGDSRVALTKATEAALADLCCEGSLHGTATHDRIKVELLLSILRRKVRRGRSRRPTKSRPAAAASGR